MEPTQSTNSIPCQDGAQFPAVRYFQIHFQHMEALLAETLSRMDELQLQVSELQLRLARKENVVSVAGQRQSSTREKAGARAWRND